MSFIQYSDSKGRFGCDVSFTTDWASQIMNYRNDGMSALDEEAVPAQHEEQTPQSEQPTPLKERTVDWTHRMLASAALVGIGLLSIIESVVRLILAVVVFPAFAITLALAIKPASQATGELYFNLASGAVASFENFLNCMVGSVKSFSSQNVDYDELIPCMADFNTAYVEATCCTGESEGEGVEMSMTDSLLDGAEEEV